jgi:hypothetical protein
MSAKMALVSSWRGEISSQIVHLRDPGRGEGPT